MCKVYNAGTFFDIHRWDGQSGDVAARPRLGFRATGEPATIASNVRLHLVSNSESAVSLSLLFIEKHASSYISTEKGPSQESSI